MGNYDRIRCSERRKWHFQGSNFKNSEVGYGIFYSNTNFATDYEFTRPLSNAVAKELLENV